MKYDEDVLAAIAALNRVLANRHHNLWEGEKDRIDSVLSILDKIRKLS